MDEVTQMNQYFEYLESHKEALNQEFFEVVKKEKWRLRRTITDTVKYSLEGIDYENIAWKVTHTKSERNDLVIDGKLNEKQTVLDFLSTNYAIIPKGKSKMEHCDFRQDVIDAIMEYFMLLMGDVCWFALEDFVGHEIEVLDDFDLVWDTFCEPPHQTSFPERFLYDWKYSALYSKASKMTLEEILRRKKKNNA